MAKEYLQSNGKILMTADGELVQVPDSENLNDLADTNGVMATQSETTSNEIEDLIVNGVIDGSPRGVYDNLSALQTAYPSGANGVYLTRDNGHWYYWNGTAWTDGGVYQTDLSYNDLRDILNAIAYEYPYKNLCGQEPDVYYEVPDGMIKSGTVLTLSTGTGEVIGEYTALNFYDENKNNLGYYGLQATMSERTITLDSTFNGTKYLKWASVSSTPLQVEIGSQKTEYIEYKPTLNSAVNDLKNRVFKTFNIQIEEGIIIAGDFADDSRYARTKNILKVFKGDKISFGFNELIGNYEFTIYEYDDDGNYLNKNTDYSNTTTNNIDILEDMNIAFRMRTNPTRDLTSDDLKVLNTMFFITRNVAVEFNERINDELSFIKQAMNINNSTLSLDYSTLKNSMSGKVNFAVQSDTHISSFDSFNGENTKISKSNFSTFKTVLNSIKKLECDAIVNLGDIIRGMPYDLAFETRKSIDDVINAYSSTNNNCLFVIGNHDDNNLYYYDTNYNDKKSVDDVLYPFEQFSRITKYGVGINNCKNYHYYDLNGIRVITLYQRDSNYGERVPYIEEFKISDNQINWLTNDALNTSNPVLILTHAPLVDNLFEGASSQSGFNSVLTALDNFKNSGGEIIAVFSGHTHKQDSCVYNGVNHIGFSNGYTFFELVSIDLQNKTISCTPVNTSNLESRNFNY